MHNEKLQKHTKHRILQELQPNFGNKAIRNLSSHQLSLTELEVLALGLNFVATPPASTHYLVLKSANRLTQTMKKQFHLRNQPLTTKHPTYCKPSTNLTLFLKQTQNLIPNATPRTTRPNLTAQQRSTLKKLGSNPNLPSNHSTRGVGYASWAPPFTSAKLRNA